MPLYQSDAFVLRTYKLGETDQIVVFFTRAYGKLRAVARRSHSPRRRLAGYCQPLTLLHTILFGRPSQNLFRINTIDIVQPFRVIHEDFGHLRSGLYLTELIDVATREHEPMPELFELMHWSLEQLPQTGHPAMLLRLFEVCLLMAMGYTPQLMYCAHCMRDLPLQDGEFSPPLGGLICSSCAPAMRQTLKVSRVALEVLHHLINNGVDGWSDQHFEAEVEQEIEALLHAHLTARLGRELKSYAFLHL